MPKKYQGADGDEEGCQTGVEIVTRGGGFNSVVFEVVVWWWSFQVVMAMVVVILENMSYSMISHQYKYTISPFN